MAAEVRALDADIPMGMTEVEDGGHKVLFIRDKTGLRAFEAACPHYGAPLAEGHICGRTLYCPWHKAAFDIGDGALVQPPALKALKQYTICVEGEKIVATLEPMAVARPSARADARTFVIVGTGAAAIAAVTTLRLRRKDRDDRPRGCPALRPPGVVQRFSRQNDRAVRDLSRRRLLQVPRRRVPTRHRDRHRARKQDRHPRVGKKIVGDALLVATGSAAVTPPFAGGDLKNIYTLRSLADAVALSDAAKPGQRIAVIGGGFIGLEAAAFLTKRGLAATVISTEPLPLTARFGDDVAHAIKVYHEGTGVQFRTGKVARFEGNGDVGAVRLDGGEMIETDIVLIGAGAKPETAAINAAKREDGGIEVGNDLQLVPGVWIAGDIAAFPDFHNGETARIEHWRLAEQHGRHAALGMLGHVTPFQEAPFFWSNQGAKRLDYAGYAPNWDKIVVRGDIAKLDFIAYYIRGDRPLAACAVGQNEQMISFLHLLGEGRLPKGETIAQTDLVELL